MSIKKNPLSFFINFKKLENLEPQQYRVIIYAFVGIFLFMIFAGIAAFMLSLQGSEKTLVPNLRGMALDQAIITLQEKELYPRLTLRFSNIPAERGKVISQSPQPGTIVKAGRRIQLEVSRGAVVDKVENFIGQDINEVKVHLQTLFAGTRALLVIQEPTIYVYSNANPGTILEQDPLPDTDIAEPAALKLVVSRGPDKPQTRVPDFIGMSMANAVAMVQKSDIVADFAMRPASRNEVPGTIVAQTPAAESLVPSNVRISLTLSSPQITQQGTSPLIASVFRRELPEYPYPLKVSLEAYTPEGQWETLLIVNHPGGPFSVPYILQEGSFLVLKVLDKEIPPREEVKNQ